MHPENKILFMFLLNTGELKLRVLYILYNTKLFLKIL